MARVPVFAPAEAGVKVTVMVHDPPFGGTGAPQQVFVWENIPTSVPEIVIEVIIRGASPVLDTVTVLEEELPMGTVPKLRANVSRAISGTSPVPLRATLRFGVSGSFELMARVAVLAPWEVGVKVTFTVQEPAGARGALQSLV